MNTRWLLAMTAVLAFFPWGAGCEAPAGGGGADTTEGEDTGGGGEVAIGGEVSGPLLQCPSGEPITGPLPLLPRPRSVLHLADPIPLFDATAAWYGETPQERRALEELAAGLGLAQTTAGEAGLRVEFLDDAAWDALLACPEAPPDGEEAYILIVDAAPGGARVRIASGADAGRRHALATLRQLLAPGPPVTVRAATILDAPAFAMRGVIEGFYGPPWSREARLALMAEV
ncbi:MAG: beta-N-acetylglucosaminidase domain-containing protein, partial [Deltaproteobacteria bacterium]|nr:beta-N-acetylglucosaminidase domain-containing protein [Deltaproteobacteria bacterium]